jgi:uncharacterized protein
VSALDPENTATWSVWEQQFAAFLQRSEIKADAAHDREHIRRVVTNARALAVAEHADLAVVLPAAWLHDCVLVPKDSPQRALASRMAATAATNFLGSIDYPARYLPAIAHAIEAHSFSAQIRPRTLEAQVVQDADRLDAIGAIGVARCLMLGGAMDKPLYQPQEPFPQRRPPDDSRYVIDHFYRKLLLLADTMTTEAGRKAAQERAAFMHQFLAQLRAEIGAE